LSMNIQLWRVWCCMEVRYGISNHILNFLYLIFDSRFDQYTIILLNVI
jgi:hypothetical protein